jgi:hypothetical protein
MRSTNGIKRVGRSATEANAEGVERDLREGAGRRARGATGHPHAGDGESDDQKAMILYVDKLNKGERPETDMKLYAGLARSGSKDRQKFTSTNLLNYRNKLERCGFQAFR